MLVEVHAAVCCAVLYACALQLVPWLRGEALYKTAIHPMAIIPTPTQHGFREARLPNQRMHVHALQGMDDELPCLY